MTQKRANAGFTLLEVMIAMSILVLALAALLGHEGIAIQMSDYSNRLSQATLLAQGKLLDVEHELLTEEMTVYDSCKSGDFGRLGMRRFRWKACAYKLEIQEGAVEQMTERFMELIGGAGLAGLGGEGALGAAAAGGADPAAAGGANPQDLVMGQLSMAIGAIPTFLTQLEDKVRKVKLEVTWEDAIGERTVLLERFVTELGSPPDDARAYGQMEQAQEDAAEDAVRNGIP